MIKKENKATALILCKDQKGIVASVTEFLHKNGANIISLDQHIDAEEEVFFMRIQWDITQFVIPKEKIAEYFKTLVGDSFDMKFDIYFGDYKPKMALFVTKASHCLYDILGRWQSGEWDVEIPLIVSNHTVLEPVAEKFGIPFKYVPITSENKKEQENVQLEMLKEAEIDFIVLARYMQVVSGEFIKQYQNRIINIHHSFLPAFPGARPYHSAYNRGVKIIGATSHYVTEDLDQGPIIEQDVERVNHVHHVKDLIRKGKDLEKIVLARAIYHHLERKTLVHKNRTIVFE